MSVIANYTRSYTGTLLSLKSRYCWCLGLFNTAFPSIICYIASNGMSVHDNVTVTNMLLLTKILFKYVPGTSDKNYYSF